MPDIFDEILGEEDRIPTDGETAKLRELCLELAMLQERKRQLESELRATNTRIWDLETKEIPDLATEIGVDRLGLPEYSADIQVGPYYKANISSEWPEERREAAFEYLESEGLGDIVRNQVIFSLGKGSEDVREALLRAARQVPDLPDPTLRRDVPWNTLTSVLREQTEKGRPLDLEIIGGTVGQRAVIKKRKD